MLGSIQRPKGSGVFMLLSVLKVTTPVTTPVTTRVTTQDTTRVTTRVQATCMNSNRFHVPAPFVPDFFGEMGQKKGHDHQCTAQDPNTNGQGIRGTLVADGHV